MWNLKFQRFLWIFSKIGQNSNKWKKNPPYLIFEKQWTPFSNKTKFLLCRPRWNSMVTMVTDEFLENRIILQKSVATIGFIWFFRFQKCILLYIFVQVFLVRRRIRSHIPFFRLGLTPTLSGGNDPAIILINQPHPGHARDFAWYRSQRPSPARVNKM